MSERFPDQFYLLLFSLSESLLSFCFFPHLLPFNTLTGLFFLFASINTTLWVIWLVFLYPFFFSPLRHLPKPRTGAYPLIGHGHLMFTYPPGAFLLRFMKEIPNDGIIHFRGFFYIDRLILTDPQSLADVLVHKSYDFEKPAWARTFLRQFLGDGLLMIEGEEHKHQRKHIMPAFTFRHIKELYPVFWQKSVQLCQVVATELLENSETSPDIDADTPYGVLEINHFSTKVTMDIIGLAGLGRDIQSLKHSNDELIKYYEELLEPSAEKGLYFILHLLLPQRLIQALPWKLNERVQVIKTNLTSICRQFVQEKRQRMKMESEDHIDILSILIKSNDFSDDSLVDQLLTFLAAGHETTSAAFTWAMHLLSIHPGVQTRLRSEVHSNLGSHSAGLDPSVDISGILESLPYLNAVCNETLRLFPTIPVSSRVAIRDTTICGQFVPKGTLSFIAPWAINRAPHLWGPDADQFKPERWIDPETGRANYMGSATSNYSLLTFLHGPRSCIGERFARAELRALVAVFCGSFEMEMADPHEVVIPAGTITSKPKNGMRLRLKAIKEW